MELTIRALSTPEEFAMAEDVQKSAWGMPDIMVTPKEIMIAMHHNGGLALGAFEAKRLVGMAIMFLGKRSGKCFMYSHMTGVSNDVQSKGVGRRLKLAQREYASRNGYDLVAWTFDPIISRNAHFNLSSLGVIARNYFPNYYGPMNDSINFGWETDRILAEWWIQDAEIRSARAALDLRDAHSAIRVSESERGAAFVEEVLVNTHAKTVLVRVPDDIVSLKRESIQEAQKWRESTRRVFLEYFSAGYSCLDFVEREGGFYYVLQKLKLPENIFLGAH